MAYVRAPLPDGFEVSLAASYYRSRAGFMAAIGLTLSSSLCCCPIASVALGPEADEFFGLTALLGLIGLVLMVVFPAIVGVILFKAETIAARTRVRVEGGVITMHDGRQLKLEDVNRFALARRHDGILVVRGWPCWVAYDNGGHAYTLAEGVHPLFDARRASAVLEEIARELGKPYRNQARMLDLGLSASNCYVPIAGLFLVFSIASLLFESGAKHRFAAKQSLLHFVLTLAVGLLGAVFSVALYFGAAAADLPPALVVIPVLLTALVVFVMNVVLRFYAMFRASKDPFWVMPWLAPLTRRWAEEAQGAPPPTRF